MSNYLASNISKLRKSKTLIISSAASAAPPATKQNATAPPPQKVDRHLKRYLTSIQEHIGKCEFYTSMQYNLKTVSYGKSTLFGAYPTKNDIESVMELMRRTGATNVMGVGSGAAIDLAKICFYECFKQDDSFVTDDGAQLILHPSTLGATLTATSRDCLSLCTQEEALLPYYCPETLKCKDFDDIHVIVDEKAIAVPMWISSEGHSHNNTLGTMSAEREKNNNATVLDCVYASLVIALDAAHSLTDSVDYDTGVVSHEDYCKYLDECVTSAVKCLDILEKTTAASLDDPTNVESTITESKVHAINTMIQAGKLLSFGNFASTPTTRRNISITLTSSLLPTYFPNGNWTTFTASLLPGVCNALGNHYGFQSVVENDTLRSVIARILGREEESAVRFSHLLEWVNEISTENACLPVPTLAKMAQGAPDTNGLLNKIDENGALLNCNDASASYFESILVSSLDR